MCLSTRVQRQTLARSPAILYTLKTPDALCSFSVLVWLLARGQRGVRAPPSLLKDSERKHKPLVAAAPGGFSLLCLESSKPHSPFLRFPCSKPKTSESWIRPCSRAPTKSPPSCRSPNAQQASCSAHDKRSRPCCTAMIVGHW